MKKSPDTKTETFTPEQIRDISVAVYKLRLEDPSGGGKGSVARMIANDKDNGEKLRGRASFYDGVTRCYLQVLGIKPS